MKIVVGPEGFGGERPRLHPKLLPNSAASSAVNTKLWRGSLRSFRDMSDVHQPTRTGEIQTFHYYNDQYWLTFNNDVDIVRGIVAEDSSKRIYYTGDGLPKKTDLTLCVAGGGTLYPNTSYPLGVPVPEDALSAAVQSAGAGTTQYSVWIYTYVTNWGEEGPPSSPSNTLTGKVGDTVRLTGFSSAPITHPNITKIRIYRSVAGFNSSGYYFIDEVSLPLTQYDDSTANADVGEALPSLYWDAPPDDMQGLIALPGSWMAGFYGNSVHCCVPYYPYAWPVDSLYRRVLEYPVVALGAYKATLVAATTEYPFLLTGAHPTQLYVEKIPARQPCVSKRGLASSELGVVYPCPDGLFLIGPGGQQVITRDIFTKDEWMTVAPQLTHAKIFDNKYIAFYKTSVVSGLSYGAGFIVDLGEPEAKFVRLNFYATAMWIDGDEDALYLMIREDDGTNTVKRWEGSASRMEKSWKSKTWVTPPVNLSAARVDADFSVSLSDSEYSSLAAANAATVASNAAMIASNATFGGLGTAGIGRYSVLGDALHAVSDLTPDEANLTFRYYADSNLVFETNLTKSSVPFRLPSGFVAREHAFEVIGTAEVEEVCLADSMEACAEGGQ